MNPQNQNWSTSRAPTPTRKFQFQFHETFYYIYYQKLAFLEVKMASEVKIEVIFEISDLNDIYCPGHFLATSFLQLNQTGTIIIHYLLCSYRTEAIKKIVKDKKFVWLHLICKQTNSVDTQGI